MIKLGPKEEQEICVICGFCCDGTLFWHATLQPGEKENLPEKIEKKYIKMGKEESFRLPCSYFLEKCSIYHQNRPDVCSSYRCQLLKDFFNKKISLKDAGKIINKVMIMRKDLMDEYHRISGKRHSLTFKELLFELGKVQKSNIRNRELSLDYDILIAQCNIFESLLIKHFRSTKDFADMMSPPKVNE